MNQISRKWMKRIGIILFIYFAVSYLTTSCLSFRMKKREFKNYYEKEPVKPELVTIRKNNWNIHFAEIGADTLPMVLFVHGTPGSWSAFRHFLKDQYLIKNLHIISVDRPGHGYSDFGRPATSISKQAELIKAVLERNKSGIPAILVGHSLGGPIIAKIAIDYPDLVGCVIMISPSIDPDLEPDEWFRLPLYLPFIRWVLPTSIDMSNREIYHLEDELRKMEPEWEKLRSPVTVIQGGQDKLVHPLNAEFAKNKILNAPVEIIFKKEVNHFIPWSHPDLIKEAIVKHLELLSSSPDSKILR